MVVFRPVLPPPIQPGRLIERFEEIRRGIARAPQRCVPRRGVFVGVAADDESRRQAIVDGDDHPRRIFRPRYDHPQLPGPGRIEGVFGRDMKHGLTQVRRSALAIEIVHRLVMVGGQGHLPAGLADGERSAEAGLALGG